MKKQTKTWLGRFAAFAGASALLALALSACSANGEKQETAIEAPAAESGAAVIDVDQNKTGKVTAGTVTTTLDMSSYDAGKTVRVWLPVAQSGDYQTVEGVTYDAPSATKAELTEDAEGNKMLYLEWDGSVQPADRTATLGFHASRDEVRVSEIADDGSVIPADVQQYLEGSDLVPVND